MSCYIYQRSIATDLGAADQGYISLRQGTYISGMLDMMCLHFTPYVVRHTPTSVNEPCWLFMNFHQLFLVLEGSQISSSSLLHKAKELLTEIQGAADILFFDIDSLNWA